MTGRKIAIGVGSAALLLLAAGTAVSAGREPGVRDSTRSAGEPHVEWLAAPENRTSSGSQPRRTRR
jgi:hypothetical protein